MAAAKARCLELWGLTGTLAVGADGDLARLEAYFDDVRTLVDAAANRFVPTSEISRLNDAGGEPVVVSEDFILLLDVALEACAMTDGLCDPTVLRALTDWGYDRDFDAIHDAAAGTARPTPGLASVVLDREARTVTLRDGAGLDFGATAKAWAADEVARRYGDGCLVELGGDVAVNGLNGGEPWVVGVWARGLEREEKPPVALTMGGLATSGVTFRTWRAGDDEAHHLIDPRTGAPARGPYAAVTVAAPSCVLANSLSTAALVEGDLGPYRIAQAGWGARFVRHDGSTEEVGSWPTKE